MTARTEHKLELRFGESGGAGAPEEARKTLRAADADASLVVDEATGIAHVNTSLDALELIDVLARAGIEAVAATG